MLAQGGDASEVTVLQENYPFVLTSAIFVCTRGLVETCELGPVVSLEIFNLFWLSVAQSWQTLKNNDSVKTKISSSAHPNKITEVTEQRFHNTSAKPEQVHIHNKNKTNKINYELV